MLGKWLLIARSRIYLSLYQAYCGLKSQRVRRSQNKEIKEIYKSKDIQKDVKEVEYYLNSHQETPKDIRSSQKGRIVQKTRKRNTQDTEDRRNTVLMIKSLFK